MSRVRIASFSVSLDGYGAGPGQSLKQPLGRGGERLHEWFLPTRTFQRMVPATTAGRRRRRRHRRKRDSPTSAPGSSAATCSGRSAAPGPTTTGKGWWGEEPAVPLPVFVLTHHARASARDERRDDLPLRHRWHRGRACACPRAAEAGTSASAVASTTCASTCRRGLIDEVHLAMTPVLLGTGEAPARRNRPAHARLRVHAPRRDRKGTACRPDAALDRPCSIAGAATPLASGRPRVSSALRPPWRQGSIAAPRAGRTCHSRARRGRGEACAPSGRGRGPSKVSAAVRSRHDASRMMSPGASTASNTSQATRPDAPGARPSHAATRFGSSLRHPIGRPRRVDQRHRGGLAGLGLVQSLFVQGVARREPGVLRQLADPQVVIEKHVAAALLLHLVMPHAACASGPPPSRRANSTATGSIRRGSGSCSGCCRRSRRPAPAPA